MEYEQEQTLILKKILVSRQFEPAVERKKLLEYLIENKD